jgi:hypothetical protein
MIQRLRSFGHFWYDFVIGDDWRVALGVVLALGVTYRVSSHWSGVWWIAPATVAILLPASLWLAVRRR